MKVGDMAENSVENYGWETSEGKYSCNYIAPEIVVLLKELEVQRVADIGTGNGHLCSTIRKNGFDAVGIEYDVEGVTIAKKTYPSIPFYNYGVQDNPTELLKQEAKFDAVVSTEVIEHLFSPHLLLQYSAPILKDNGCIIVTTPYHGYLKNILLSIFNKWDYHHTALWHGGHIKFWSRRTLTSLIEENGFQVVSFSGVGRVPFLWKSMILVARKRKHGTVINSNRKRIGGRLD